MNARLCSDNDNKNCSIDDGTAANDVNNVMTVIISSTSGYFWMILYSLLSSFLLVVCMIVLVLFAYNCCHFLSIGPTVNPVFIVSLVVYVF